MSELKQHFEQATEEFEFTAELGGWRGKKVFRFVPSTGKYSEGVVSELGVFARLMNVKSFSSQGIMLYTFDMLGNKITGKIKWSDIELGNTVDVDEHGNPTI